MNFEGGKDTEHPRGGAAVRIYSLEIFGLIAAALFSRCVEWLTI
jgi:hypothetical protein